jgi:drug/metabolite transporter (DMT)-like permease
MRQALERRRAVGMLLLANVFWGLSFPLIKAITLLNARLVPAAGGGYIVGLALAPRFLVGFLILLGWQAWRRGDGCFLTRAELRNGFWLGLYGGGGMLLQSDGLRFTVASTSAFLTQAYAIMIPLWLALRWRRSPPAVVWAGCALVLAGIALLGHFDWRQLRLGRGEWETLGCSVLFMVQILRLGSPQAASDRPAKITLVWFGVEAVLFGALALRAAPSAGALASPWASPAWLLLTLMLAGFCTVGAFLLMARWQPVLTSTEAGLMYCFEPIFGALFALGLPALFSRWSGISYPNENATVGLVVGGGLITIANLVVQRQPAPSTP